MTRLISDELREGVLHVVLDVPGRRNALSRALVAQLLSAMTDRPPGTLAVVLSGRDGFSAGADLADISGTAQDVAFDDALAELTGAMRELPVPVLAAVEGPCVGAAVDLALAADVRIAGRSAWFEVPATRLGLLYSPTVVARMHRRLAADTLARLLVLGERFTAVDAHAAGLVSTVVQEGAAAGHAHALAMRTAGYPAESVHETKRLLSALEAGRFDSDHWQTVRLRLMDSPERRRAVTQARERVGIPTAEDET